MEIQEQLQAVAVRPAKASARAPSKLKSMESSEDMFDKLQKHKLHLSTFMITINGQRVVDPAAPWFGRYSLNFADAVESALSGDGLGKYIYEIDIQDKKNYGALLPRPKQFKCYTTMRVKYEVGGKQKRLHCHALLRIIHNSYIRLDNQKMRRDISDALGFSDTEQIHLNIRSYRDNAWFAEMYLNKNDGPGTLNGKLNRALKNNFKEVREVDVAGAGKLPAAEVVDMMGERLT